MYSTRHFRAFPGIMSAGYMDAEHSKGFQLAWIYHDRTALPPGGLHNNNPFTLPHEVLHLQRTCVTIVHTPQGEKHPLLPLLQWDNLVIGLMSDQYN